MKWSCPIDAYHNVKEIALSHSAYTQETVTSGQLEKIRLVLSTYQDGSGQLARPNGKTLPGWRDFERAVALAFQGVAQESKAIYDVIVPLSAVPGTHCGIACKMRKLLRDVQRTGRVTIEVSNSSGRFWDALQREGLDDFETAPARAGDILLRLVEQWHDDVDIAHGGNIDNSKSFYLVLQWDEKTLTYQMYQYALTFPDPTTLSWSAQGRRLVGEDARGVIIEWYGRSGGQLKYYPPVEQAIWVSAIFTLEPLPGSDEVYGVLRKVREYYPELWQRACESH